MSQPMKQTFLHGTMLLTISAALVKVIGALYKIPLNAIIGEQGFSYFNTAYEIYSVLMTLSVAGLPLAMSRMIAEASALGQYNQVRRIYSTARALFFTMGMLGSLLMVVFCRQLAAFLVCHRVSGSSAVFDLHHVHLPRLLPGSEQHASHRHQPGP